MEDGMSLMEIKTANAIPKWMVDILSSEKIRKTSFSKYGRAYLQMLDDRNNNNVIGYDFTDRKVG